MPKSTEPGLTVNLDVNIATNPRYPKVLDVVSHNIVSTRIKDIELFHNLFDEIVPPALTNAALVLQTLADGLHAEFMGTIEAGRLNATHIGLDLTLNHKHLGELRQIFHNGNHTIAIVLPNPDSYPESGHKGLDGDDAEIELEHDQVVMLTDPKLFPNIRKS